MDSEQRTHLQRLQAERDAAQQAEQQAFRQAQIDGKVPKHSIPSLDSVYRDALATQQTQQAPSDHWMLNALTWDKLPPEQRAAAKRAYLDEKYKS